MVTAMEHQIKFTEHDLAFCTVCKGGEGELTTECCGRPMTVIECYKVYNLGTLDFVDGKWKNKQE